MSMYLHSDTYKRTKKPKLRDRIKQFLRKKSKEKEDDTKIVKSEEEVSVSVGEMVMSMGMIWGMMHGMKVEVVADPKEEESKVDDSGEVDHEEIVEEGDMRGSDGLVDYGEVKVEVEDIVLGCGGNDFNEAVESGGVKTEGSESGESIKEEERSSKDTWKRVLEAQETCLKGIEDVRRSFGGRIGENDDELDEKLLNNEEGDDESRSSSTSKLIPLILPSRSPLRSPTTAPISPSRSTNFIGPPHPVSPQESRHFPHPSTKSWTRLRKQSLHETRFPIAVPGLEVTRRKSPESTMIYSTFGRNEEQGGLEGGEREERRSCEEIGIQENSDSGVRWGADLREES